MRVQQSPERHSPVHKLLHHLHAGIELIESQNVLLSEEAEPRALPKILREREWERMKKRDLENERKSVRATALRDGSLTLSTEVQSTRTLTMLCLRILWTTGVNTSITTIDRGRSRQCCRQTDRKPTERVSIIPYATMLQLPPYQWYGFIML